LSADHARALAVYLILLDAYIKKVDTARQEPSKGK